MITASIAQARDLHLSFGSTPALRCAYSPYNVLGGMSTTGITWPAANVPAARLGTLGVDAVNVGTDGSTAAIERARTLLENAFPAFSPPTTLRGIVAQDHSTDSDYQQLANVVILISLPIAGCTLAAGITGPEVARND